MILINLLVFIIGFAIVVVTLMSAIRTFVVPRAEQVFLTRMVFIQIRRIFNLWLARAQSYKERDRILGYYAPISLITLLPVWYALMTIGYMFMFWATGAPSWLDAFRESGSSLLTLGFVPPAGLVHTLLVFTEALNGLLLIAILIAYLPTMYSAFQRRESLVTMLEVRAGSPPSAVEMIERYHRIHGLDRLTATWQDWEAWFADIEESHTSLAALIYFRSPHPNRHWATAAGAVLDGAALAASTLDLPRNPQAELCLRAGYLALRSIADLLNFKHDANPKPTDPISVRREEFEAVYERLAREGIPLKRDRDQAWRDFAGWRVNYDRVLLGIVDVTMAPLAPWSSDRSLGKARELRQQ